jgi:hypothetical protein
MKILMVMDKRVDRGSIQAVANYVRAGDDLGHEIALYGSTDPKFPRVRFSRDVERFDHALFIIESWRGWLTGIRLPPILTVLPRRRRAILDADGKYNQVIMVDGYDHNHSSEAKRAGWIAYYRVLADRVFQPTTEPLERDVRPLPFYGYDPGSQAQEGAPKRFDILHVGHNWWRWREMREHLLPAMERIRSHAGEICFVGSWWDSLPEEGKGRNPAFGLDSDWLQRLQIQVRRPVGFGEVIPLMSTGRVNILSQRPLFVRLRMLTSKYFEVFSADTIPLLLLRPEDAELVYGPAGRDLALYDRIDEKLLDALKNPERYKRIVHQVRCHLAAHHSYRVRVQELVSALEA